MQEKSKHVALYIYNLGQGGAERVFTQLANCLARDGFSVDLLLWQAIGPNVSLVSSNVRIIDLGATNVVQALIKLVGYLWRVTPDLLLSTLTLPNLSNIIACWITFRKTKAIVRVASMPSYLTRSPLKKWTEKWLLRLLYPLADALIAVSKAVADDLMAFAKIERDRIAVIYNPVLSPEFEKQKSGPVQELVDVFAEKKVILGVGRLSKVKNFPALIEVFSIIKHQPDLALVFLGEGEERARLEELVERLGLKELVYFPGYVDNPYPYMCKASVVVLPSRYEGLSNVLIQALGCGTPVVATDCPGGNREILNFGEFGYLVPVDDKEALADAIIRAVSSPRSEIPEFWLKQFRTEVVCGRYADIIGRLSEGKLSLGPK